MPFIFFRTITAALEQVSRESGHAEICPGCVACIIGGIMTIVAVIWLLKILFCEPRDASR